MINTEFANSVTMTATNHYPVSVVLLSPPLPAAAICQAGIAAFLSPPETPLLGEVVSPLDTVIPGAGADALLESSILGIELPLLESTLASLSLDFSFPFADDGGYPLPVGVAVPVVLPTRFSSSFLRLCIS